MLLLQMHTAQLCLVSLYNKTRSFYMFSSEGNVKKRLSRMTITRERFRRYSKWTQYHGRNIGAITHVFTTGYGVFIENMLEATE